MLPISLCMIVKNEESCIEKCLKAARNYFDDIVIADTGSTDLTKSICGKYTDKVYDFVWIDDFSAARNFSVSYAKHNWVLCLDADEVIEIFNEISLSQFIKDKNSVGRILINSTNASQIHKMRVSRLFCKDVYSFEGIIHEQLISKTNKYAQGKDVDITVIHSGYEEETFMEKKYERNLYMLQKALEKVPNDNYFLFHLGRVYYGAKQYENAAQCFRKLFDTTPDYKLEYIKDAFISFGYSLVNSNSAEEFMKYEDYLVRYSYSPDVLFVYAFALMNCGKFEQAADMFLECTKLPNPDEEGVNSYKAFFNAGVIYQCSGDIPSAIEAYKKCGDYPPALNQLKLLV